LQEFQNNWQRPFQATHSVEFTGLAANGKRIEIRCMDFWKVEDGKVTDNCATVDFPHVLARPGKDVFDGEGWAAFDRCDKVPPRPDN